MVGRNNQYKARLVWDLLLNFVIVKKIVGYFEEFSLHYDILRFQQ